MSKTESKERGNGADSTMATLVIASLVALGIGAVVNWSAGRKPWQATTATTSVAVAPKAAAPSASEAKPVAAVTTAAPVAATTTAVPAAVTAGNSGKWAASATGRIEPRDGELRLVPALPGRILEVLVAANDQVTKGDLMVRVDDEDALLKASAATAEVDVRKRERDEEPATGLALDRRRAEDAVADADRQLFQARQAFDAIAAMRFANQATAQDLTAARSKITAAEQRIGQEKGKLVQVLAKPGMPLPTRLESSLATARADLSAAEAAVEKLRLRAPYDGTVLTVSAKAGEYSAPSPELSLVTFGDVSSLRVRAEVEERDAVKVRVGQPIVVRADAFPDTEFTGVVTSVSKTLGPPRMTARGPRRPNDVEVLDVKASLDGTPPLLTGMRVDVYFKLDKTATAEPGKK